MVIKKFNIEMLHGQVTVVRVQGMCYRPGLKTFLEKTLSKEKFTFPFTNSLNCDFKITFSKKSLLSPRIKLEMGILEPF